LFIGSDNLVSVARRKIRQWDCQRAAQWIALDYVGSATIGERKRALIFLRPISLTLVVFSQTGAERPVPKRFTIKTLRVGRRRAFSRRGGTK
jgi:hypothetical protein